MAEAGLTSDGFITTQFPAAIAPIAGFTDQNERQSHRSCMWVGVMN